MAIRNANGLLLGPPSPRSVLRVREKYLLVAIVFTFIVFCVIGMAYLPELKSTSRMYLNYIKQPADQLGPNLLGLIPPDLEERDHGVSAVLPPPRSRFEDEARLREKVEQHFNLSQEAVIPRPNLHNEQRDGLEVKTSSEKMFSKNGRKPISIPELPDGRDPDPEFAQKRDKVKQMMIIAWDNYAKYAWGDNELKPISKKGHSAGIFGGNTKLGATIVDGMDTLWIMGLKDRFADGREWISNNLDLSSVNTDMSVFETIIRFVGGLLSCYAFTGDEVFLNKATAISEAMLPAFDTPTGLPHALIKPASGKSKNYHWASQSNSILSEVGTLSLEFAYLSATTGDGKYFEKIDRVRTLLDSLDKPEGLYPNYINPKTGKFGQKHVSIGALGDSFYEYLLKLWLMLDKKDTTALRMYNEAIEAMDKKLVQKSKSGLVYMAELKYERLEHKMGHLACFAAGMYALGAAENAHEESRGQHFAKLGADLAHTCHESYRKTKTGIGPEVFWFSGDLDAQIGRQNERYYILRPEVIEGWFYLWRLTKDRKYRDWAWDAVLAIEKHCLVPGGAGYSGINNVDSEEPMQDDVQQSYFLAETLKYLYLIFSSDDLISFNQWVFNTEGHPLPIKNRNTAFPVA